MSERNSKSTFVVLDTNIFAYETRLLSTALGAAFMHSLSRSGARLAVPEIIELEIRKHTQKQLEEAKKAVTENYELIAHVMGSRDDYRLPSTEAIESRVDNKLVELDGLVVRIPFKWRHAQGALKRVIAETPPNSEKNQQFKDSAIWEAIVELSEESDVHLVTKDKGFFQDRNPSNGLADNLRTESENAANRIIVYDGLNKYLQKTRKETPPFNKAKVAQAVAQFLHDDLQSRAENQGYRLGELTAQGISPFFTETPRLLTIEFQLTYKAKTIEATDAIDVIDCKHIVKGNCSYNETVEEASNVQLSDLKFFDLDGKRLPGGAQIVNMKAAHLHTRHGTGTIHHTIRKRIDE